MANQVRTFSLEGWKAIVGVTEVTGFQLEEACAIAPVSDIWTWEVGTQQEVVRAKVGDPRFTITFNLLQGTPTNEAFSSLMLTDKLTNGGIVPILLIDTNGTSIHSASQCWVARVPDTTYGNQVKQRSWVFWAANLDGFIGKNN